MNRYFFTYRISGVDYWGEPIEESLGTSQHTLDARSYEQAEQEFRALFPDRITIHIVEYTVLTDIDSLRLLEDVNKKAQNTVFREEREFLQALRKKIEEDTPLTDIKTWLEEIQTRTDTAMFSSVHCATTELLNYHFKEEIPA